MIVSPVQRPLPRGEHLFRIVLARRVVDLVQDVHEFREVGALERPGHEVIEGVRHRSRLGMARIEEHQHEIRDVDDVIGDAQRGGALRIGIEAGRVDEDLAAQCFAVAGLELEAGVEARTFARDLAIDLAA